MRRLLAKKWFRIFAALVAVCCSGIPIICWRFRIWSYRDYWQYEEVRAYPVGEDLWFRRIVAGQGSNDLISRLPPHEVRQYGRFTMLLYYQRTLQPNEVAMERLIVIAKEGRLVRAVLASCTWHRVFFEMSADDTAEFNESFERHLKDKGLL
jgi:hypothetical protein